MATLVIRNLDDDVKQELRTRAAARGVSMEQEARDVITRDVRNGNRRLLKVSFDDVMSLSRKAAAPIDSKRAQDEVWDYLYESERSR